MTAPEYVPTDPAESPRLVWTSPPRRPEPWMADRPGDFPRRSQPRARRYGSPGPDQGYVYTLLPLFDDKLHLTSGEHRHDVDAGCCEVAMKRCSIFGRAPTVHDLTVAFTIWGYLDADPPTELLTVRKALFEGAGHEGAYLERRRIADAVPAEALALTVDEVIEAHRVDWRALVDLTGEAVERAPVDLGTLDEVDQTGTMEQVEVDEADAIPEDADTLGSADSINSIDEYDSIEDVDDDEAIELIDEGDDVDD